MPHTQNCEPWCFFMQKEIAAVKQLENSVAEEAVAEVEAEVVAEAKAPSAQKPVSTDDFYEVVDDDQ